MMARYTRDQLQRFRALTEAQAVLGWGVILVLGALVGSIYVNQASQIASVGRRVQVMQAELSEIKRENNAVEREIAQAQQIDRLQAEAARLGFVPANTENIEYIIIPNYPEDKPMGDPLAAQPTAVPLPEPPATLSEVLWLTLREWVSGFVQGEANE